MNVVGALCAFAAGHNALNSTLRLKLVVDEKSLIYLSVPFGVQLRWMISLGCENHGVG